MKYKFILAGRSYALGEALKNNKNFEIISPRIVGNIFLKIVYKLHFKSFFPLKNLWFKYFFPNLDKKINKEDIIIILDSDVNIFGLSTLNEIYPKNKKILWFFNTNDYNEKIINKQRKYVDKICSFDENDCFKYNFNYFYKFFPLNNIIGKEEKNYQHDVVFIGLNKNRIKKINRVKDILKKYDKTYFFHVLNEKKFKKIEGTTKKRIDYKETEKYIFNSKILLEFLKEGQTGITIRTLEAFYNKKKLITNNQSIKNMDFYKKENIFIIDDSKEDFDIPKEFFLTPFNELDEAIIEKYKIENWVKELTN